jgi:hypothetical protein
MKPPLCGRLLIHCLLADCCLLFTEALCSLELLLNRDGRAVLAMSQEEHATQYTREQTMCSRGWLASSLCGQPKRELLARHSPHVIDGAIEVVHLRVATARRGVRGASVHVGQRDGTAVHRVVSGVAASWRVRSQCMSKVHVWGTRQGTSCAQAPWRVCPVGRKRRGRRDCAHLRLELAELGGGSALGGSLDAGGPEAFCDRLELAKTLLDLA